MAAPAPPSLPIRQALDRSEPLARLAQRLKESRQRFEAILPLLPPALQTMVQPGPVDTDGWALLARNGAVAAKLRHMVPALETRLVDLGWPALPIRVRVLTAG
ncbi:hypothetical protein [Ideonella sp. A 288]|uniref:hypothetical protein n=1 Tax=Ideonella sp. A 288 TaxID=1962181 RepID=UPI000B4B8D9E|nr:hypothetical protein [Ideonella sp. A 288]